MKILIFKMGNKFVIKREDGLIVGFASTVEIAQKIKKSAERCAEFCKAMKENDGDD